MTVISTCEEPGCEFSTSDRRYCDYHEEQNRYNEHAPKPGWQPRETEPHGVPHEIRGIYTSDDGLLWYVKVTHWRPMKP